MCELCDLVNTTFNAAPKQLTPLPIMELFYRWGVDLAGPMNLTSSAGNKYDMVLVEHFTKHIEAVAIPDTLAATTAQGFVEAVLCRYSSCEKIYLNVYAGSHQRAYSSCTKVVTGGGTEFAGEFDEVLKMVLIDPRSAPNHP